MEVNFKHKDPAKVDPIYIEQVFAEKPGGGLVENPSFDVPPITAVGEKSGKFVPIKCYRLVGAVAKADTAINIAKGSGIAVGDAIATGKKAVACTAVDTSAEDKDVVTITLGVDLEAGVTLYQAKAASEDAAEPIHTPVYVTGNRLAANEGDQSVRLINGANLRKETANIASEVAALLPMIALV
ncbi:hypothetical protein [Phocaeicola faecalis]